MTQHALCHALCPLSIQALYNLSDAFTKAGFTARLIAETADWHAAFTVLLQLALFANGTCNCMYEMSV